MTLGRFKITTERGEVQDGKEQGPDVSGWLEGGEVEEEEVKGPQVVRRSLGARKDLELEEGLELRLAAGRGEPVSVGGCESPGQDWSWGQSRIHALTRLCFFLQ